MQVLGNDPAAPEDLRLKALYLAGRVIEFDPDVRGGRGFAITRDILESGRALDNYRVNRIASLAGAPMYKGAGVDLLKKVGDRVAAGGPLYRLHAQFQANFNFARTMIEKDTGFVISENLDTDTLNA